MLFQFGGARFGGGSFGSLFYYLESWGVRDVILPFILFFTILFAVLQKVSLFGSTDESKKYNVVLSIVISLLVVIPHVMGLYPPEKDVVRIVNEALPGVVLIIVAVVMLLLMMSLIVGKRKSMEGFVPNILAILAVLAVIGIFASSISPLPFLSNIDPRLRDLLVALLVFGLIVWFLTKKPGTWSEGKSPVHITFGEAADETTTQTPATTPRAR